MTRDDDMWESVWKDLEAEYEYWKKQTQAEYPTMHAMTMRKDAERRLCEHWGEDTDD